MVGRVYKKVQSRMFSLIEAIFTVRALKTHEYGVNKTSMVGDTDERGFSKDRI